MCGQCFKVDSGGTNELEEGKYCPLVPVSSRTGLGAAGPLPGAKRGHPGHCIPKDRPHLDSRPTWLHPEVPTFAQRAKASKRMHSR